VICLALCWLPVITVSSSRLQNSKSIKGQIKYLLVYCMENAILNLPPEKEQLVWLVDFNGFNLSHISLKETRETAHVLQDHYPECLGLAILYNPPKFFEPFWMLTPYLFPLYFSKFLIVGFREFLLYSGSCKYKVLIIDCAQGNNVHCLNELLEISLQLRPWIFLQHAM